MFSFNPPNLLKKVLVPLCLLLFCSQGYAQFLPQSKPQGTPVHRFWSDVFKHQFVTLGEGEKNQIIENDSNWRYDGIAYYAFAKQQPGTVPLYRFWSDVFQGHFYTISESEKEATENNSDWRYEGIAFYVYPNNNKAPAQAVPIYRLWSDQDHFRGHFYTSFYEEVNSLEYSGNYRAEGVAFKAIGNPGMCKKVGAHMPPFEEHWSDNPPYDDYSQAIVDYHGVLEKHHNIIMFFSSWENGEGMFGFGKPFPRAGEPYQAAWLADQVTRAGATPLITWEPWKEFGGIEQPDYSLDAIVNGDYDAYLHRYASDVKAWGKPVLLRLMHEMNGDYYPWSCTLNNGDPSRYVAAFRHVVNVFTSEKAANAYFVWSPNYASPPAVSATCSDLDQLYPGDDYVDYIATSVYNWGSDTSRGPGWTSLEVLADDFFNAMAIAHPDKEVILAETGTAHDESLEMINQWITEAYRYLATRGTVTAVVNFDDFAFHDPSFTDFRVTVGHDWADYPLEPAITETHKAAISNYCD